MSLTPDDRSGRLIALRDHLRYAIHTDDLDAVKDVADALDELITARVSNITKHLYDDGASLLEDLIRRWRKNATADGSVQTFDLRRVYQRCADELDELITALLRPQREENTAEDPTDDPRNRASVLRSETEPTR